MLAGYNNFLKTLLLMPRIKNVFIGNFYLLELYRIYIKKIHIGFIFYIN